MSVQLQEVLSVELVLIGIELLRGEEEEARFRRDAAVEVLTRPSRVAGGRPVPDHSRALVLSRERIAVDTSLLGTVIRWDYPWGNWSRFGEVVTLAVGPTAETHEVELGYNVDLVFTQDSGQPSSAYLGERLLNPSLLGQLGWPLRGGGAQVSLRDENRTWAFIVEPRAEDLSGNRVFLRVSLQWPLSPIPSTSQITASLQESLDQAMRLMQILDGEQ